MFAELQTNGSLRSQQRIRDFNANADKVSEYGFALADASGYLSLTAAT